jgi:sugar phosphate permease
VCWAKDYLSYPMTTAPPPVEPPLVSFSLPCRWQMILLITSGIVLSYTLRVNISVAAVEMQQALGWGDREKSLIFSAFYVGYALGQVPAALGLQYYGAKHTLGCSVLCTAALSLLFPSVIKSSYSAGFVLRCLIGLAASPAFPSCYYFYKSWVPKSEKMIMIPFVTSGIYLVKQLMLYVVNFFFNLLNMFTFCSRFATG